jgi:hypothetical protein
MINFIVVMEEKVHSFCVLLQRIQNFKRLYLSPSQLRKKVALIMPILFLVITLVNFLLLIFSVKTWISILLFLYALKKYILKKWEDIREVGFIHFMSPEMQALFLNRSIFDVLCDLWFFPRVSLYFKALLMPLIFEIKPEVAIDQLSILPEPDRKVLLTKGVVYILPNNIKKIFLPSRFERHKKIQEFFEEEPNDNILEGKRVTDNSDIKVINEILNASSHSIVDDNSNKERINNETQSSDPPGTNLVPKIKKEIKRESSKVIISSRMLKELKGLPGKMTDRWDNLHLYNLKKEEKNLIKTNALVRKTSIASEISETPDKSLQNKVKKENISPIGIVLGMIELKKQKFLKRFSRRSLYFILILSLTVFSLKLGFSKNYRIITKNMILNLSYLGVIGAGTISLAAILMQNSVNPKKSLAIGKGFIQNSPSK